MGLAERVFLTREVRRAGMIGKRPIGQVGSQPADPYSGDPKSDALRSRGYATVPAQQLYAYWALCPSIVAGFSIAAAGATPGPVAQEPIPDAG